MKKVLLATFAHESNAFAPMPADLAAFKTYPFLFGQEIIDRLSGGNSYINGFIQTLSRDDIQLIPSVFATANPSGPVTAEVYDIVTQAIAESIRTQGPVDGIVLNLHGAMMADGRPDAEGDFLEFLRELVGPNVPIAASLDLHANVTERMARYATALIPCENYPHTDTFVTGCRTAQILLDALDGTAAPVMAYRRIPFLLPLFPTDEPEMRALYEKAHALQTMEGIDWVGFSHGFFAADIEEMGMSVTVIARRDAALAESVAEEMAAAIRAAIPQLRRTYISLDEALDRTLLPGSGPVVLADSSDNPGAGGPGDSTHILRRILERGITGCAFASITDPASVAICEQAGVGATVALQLGGWTDPRYSGGPLGVSARVRRLSDGSYIHKGPMSTGTRMNMGKAALVEIAGNLVIIATYARQHLDLEVFRSLGIEPAEQKLLVTKSSVHYRASFGTVAREMIPLALPGYAPPTPETLPFRNWKGTV